MGWSRSHQDSAKPSQWDGVGTDLLVCGALGVGALGALALASMVLRRSAGVRLPTSGFQMGGGGELRQLQIHHHARRVSAGQRCDCRCVPALIQSDRYLLHPEDAVPLMTATPTDPTLYLDDTTGNCYGGPEPP